MDIFLQNKKIDKLRYSDKISGIYKISNTISNKCYIGSTNNAYHRYRTHISLLKRNKHYSLHLQKAYNKYKEENFKFHVFRICDKKFLLPIEQFYLSIFRPSYNNLVIANSNLGSKLSEEHKRKISIALKGVPKSKSHADNVRMGLKITQKYGKDHPNAKIVVQYTKTGKYIGTYGCAKEVENILGYPARGIKRVCRKECKTSSGYVWKFL